MSTAVISYRGNQYKVEEGKEYQVDKLEESDIKNNKIVFSDVLLFSNDKEIVIGEPNITSFSVTAEVLGEERGDKVLIVKFRPKKRYKRTAGHRQTYARIKILEIKHNEK